MFGLGILRGMGITLKHFITTYVDDLKWMGRRYANTDAGLEVFKVRQGAQSQGIITVQYPEEKISVPERFRFIPFLVVEGDPPRPGEEVGHDWCTSCGICAKVCPPQCIWIVRSNNPETGRPVPEPEAFYIDIDICMNCGYCAEYCPFDAIKMDHVYELASYDRTAAHIYDLEKLSKSHYYWEEIAPNIAAAERTAREEEAAKKAAQKKQREQRKKES